MTHFLLIGSGDPVRYPVRKMYAICFRLEDVEREHPTAIKPWMRQRPCCDCGRLVLCYNPAGIMWELIREWLFICSVCAKHREIDCGGTARWTFDVTPRPRDDGEFGNSRPST